MRHEEGFTLIELSLVVVLAAILAGALIPNFVRSVHIEASRKAAMDMSQLAEAARGFYIQNNVWPADLVALQATGFVDTGWDGKNPFGHSYALQPDGINVQITTTVPQAMGSVVAGLLPMTVAQGSGIMMSVTPPGSALAAVPTGTIIPWTSAVIPEGWLVCDGHAVPRSVHVKLFTVIGTTYGAGDGTTTFNLPDLRGRTIMGLDDMGIGAAHVVTDPLADNLGGTLGEEKHVLSVSEMPSHAHGYNESPWTGGRYDGHSSPLITSQVASMTQPAGGNQAHNNIQPSMALYWIIKV